MLTTHRKNFDKILFFRKFGLFQRLNHPSRDQHKLSVKKHGPLFHTSGEFSLKGFVGHLASAEVRKQKLLRPLIDVFVYSF